MGRRRLRGSRNILSDGSCDVLAVLVLAMFLPAPAVAQPNVIRPDKSAGRVRKAMTNEIIHDGVKTGVPRRTPVFIHSTFKR